MNDMDLEADDSNLEPSLAYLGAPVLPHLIDTEAVAGTEELLNRYDSWLFFERRLLAAELDTAVTWLVAAVDKQIAAAERQRRGGP